MNGEEQYNDTRRWRRYEAALLMKKNEIRTDEEAPLTTPEDASVLEYCRPLQESTGLQKKNHGEVLPEIRRYLQQPELGKILF